MKKVILLLSLFFLVGCQDYSELDFKVNRLQGFVNSVQTEQEGLKEKIKQIDTNLDRLEKEFALQEDFDNQQSLLIEKLNKRTLFFAYDRRIYELDRVLDLFQESQHYYGKLKDQRFYVYEVMNMEPFKQVTTDDLRPTGEVVDLIFNNQTEYAYIHGEGLSKEEFFKLLFKDDFCEVQVINNHVLYIWNGGPVQKSQ